jgi:ssDNA-binding Zn-finger/Zn-ribbon topoisomerase 1
MTTRLASRVRRLEKAAGAGGECSRCSGTTVIYVNDRLESVSRTGRLFTQEEARVFVEEEEDGRCPRCGTRRGPTIRIGWAEP